MKKMYICFVLICVAVLIASIAFADDHTHIWDVNYTYSYRYTDEGDAHHRIQIRKRACIVDGCSQYWAEETGVIYVEGHNYALTYYSDHRGSVGSGYHLYTFKCMECLHATTRNGSCDGPPCEMIYLPSRIYKLVDK